MGTLYSLDNTSVPITALDVATWAGRADDVEFMERIGGVIPQVGALVAAYTRDKGFDEFGWPLPGVAAVIASVCTRVAANPEQLQQTLTTGPYTHTIAGWQGFTLLERQTLDRWRVRAM